ncbi:MAG: hypothetical protein Q4C05_05470 [Akkermansia sp.]|nr:hypothetical protein [Akkermansia sp.]
MQLKELPGQIREPIMVLESGTGHPNSVELITELEENGHKVLVAVKLNTMAKGKGRVRVNRIISLYGKEKLGELLKHKILYADIERARAWLLGRGVQFPTALHQSTSSRGSIKTREDLVKRIRGGSYGLISERMVEIRERYGIKGSRFNHKWGKKRKKNRTKFRKCIEGACSRCRFPAPWASSNRLSLGRGGMFEEAFDGDEVPFISVEVVDVFERILFFYEEIVLNVGL